MSARRGTSAQTAGAVRTAILALLPWLRQRGAWADQQGRPCPEVWQALHEAGVLAAPLSVERGGASLTAPENTAVLVDCLRLLGSADLSVARIYEGHVNALALVDRYGDAAQSDSLAASVRDAALSAVWAADDAQRLQAERGESGVCLSGRKVYASGAGLVRRPLVTAATAAGPLLLLLDLAPGERADLSGWTPQGMRASATGTVDLDGVRVGADLVVGQPGDFNRQPVLSGGAWRFCAVHLGAAERLVDLFREHLVGRARGEDPYQLQRLAECAAAVGTAGFWVRDAAQRLAGANGDPQDIVAFVNLARMVVERAALDVLEAVHRGAGLPGFLRPNPIEQLSRDLSTYLRQPVPDLAMADAGRVVLAAGRPIGEMWAVP